VLAIIGFLGIAWTARKEKESNYTSLSIFVAFIVLSLFQTFNPQYSNG
jgi:hydroxylaminobenzene mutase